MSGRIFRLDIPAHQAVQELLPWYVSAQLAPEEAARVQEHLHGCDECQHEADAARRLRGLEPDAPPGLDVDRALSRMMAMLGEQETAPPAATTSMAAQSPTSAAQPSPAAATYNANNAAPASASGPAASHTPLEPVALTTAPRAPSEPAMPPTIAAPAPGWTPRRAANQSSWMRWAMAAQAVAIAGLLVLLARPAADEANYHVLGSGAVLSGNLVVVFKPDTAEKELRRVLLANGARVVDGPTDTDAYLLNVPMATRDHALLSLRAEPSVMLVESLQAGAAP